MSSDNVPVGNTFNFGSITQTASGAGSVNNVGNNTVSTTVNNGERIPTVPEVFEAIEKALPDPSPEVVPSMEISEAQEAVTELRTIAIMPQHEQDTPTVKEKMTSLLNVIVPYAPQIGKGLAVFGNAALTALASSNPVVSGILAVCKMASSENQSQSV